MKNIIMILIFLNVVNNISYSQPGYGNLLLNVFDTKTGAIIFRDTVNNGYKFFSKNGNKHLGVRIKKNKSESGVYTPSGDSLIQSMVMIQRPIGKIIIRKGFHRMTVKIINQPDYEWDMIIDSLVFKPGHYVLDCKKTKNNYSSKKEYSSYWDITPGKKGLSRKKGFKRLFNNQ